MGTMRPDLAVQRWEVRNPHGRQVGSGFGPCWAFCCTHLGRTGARKAMWTQISREYPQTDLFTLVQSVTVIVVVIVVVVIVVVRRKEKKSKSQCD